MNGKWQIAIVFLSIIISVETFYIISILQFSSMNIIQSKDSQIQTLTSQKNQLQTWLNNNLTLIKSLNETHQNYVLTHSHSNIEYNALTNAYQNLKSSFTRFEKLEFQSGYAVAGATVNDPFEIKIRLKNTGSADATIDMVFLNAKPAGDYTGGSAVTLPAGLVGMTLAPGSDSGEQVVQLSRAAGTTWKSGMSVELVIQTVAGRQYPKVIILP